MTEGSGICYILLSQIENICSEIATHTLWNILMDKIIFTPMHDWFNHRTGAFLTPISKRSFSIGLCMCCSIYVPLQILIMWLFGGWTFTTIPWVISPLYGDEGLMNYMAPNCVAFAKCCNIFLGRNNKGKTERNIVIMIQTPLRLIVSLNGDLDTKISATDWC